MTDIPEDVMKAAEDTYEAGHIGEDWYLHLHILAVARAIMAERARYQLQPMETAPKDGTPVVLYRDRGRGRVDIDLGWYAEERGWGGHGFIYPDWSQPSAWMPLPKPPEVS